MSHVFHDLSRDVRCDGQSDFAVFKKNDVYFVSNFSLAPDYILCSKPTESLLIPAIVKAWQSFYTDNPIDSDSYCHIVNKKHFERVKNLIDTTKVVHGGNTDVSQNYISPTIM